MIRKDIFAAALACAGALAGAPAPAEAQETFTCAARGNDRNNDRTYCRVDTTDGVRLVRQLSRADCERGRTWGADRRGVWVARGCRAQFITGRRRDARDNRNSQQYDPRYDNRGSNATSSQAERFCYDAVAKRYNLRGNDVRVQSSAMDRDGNYTVRWATRERAGTCRVNEYGRVFDFRAN